MSAVSPVAGPVPSAPANDRAALSQAARQFEAIFVRRMLSAARETHFDDGGLFSSQALGTFRQMQDDRFADIASDRGAFGLAKMIEAHLAKQMPSAKPLPQAGGAARLGDLSPSRSGAGLAAQRLARPPQTPPASGRG